MRGEVAFGFKDTFWNTLRVNRGWKLKEVAETLGLNTQVVGSYMTGQNMPSERVIKLFCDLFDVDIVRGTSEFTKAHREWDAEHKRVYRLHPNKTEATKTETPKEEVKDTHAEEVLAVAEQFNKKFETKEVKNEDKPLDYAVLEKADKILEMLYRRIEYREFANCFRAILNGEDVRKALYGNVDYDTYNMIEKIYKDRV